MTSPPGIGGSLFPGRFLAAASGERAPPGDVVLEANGRRRALETCWRRIEESCGPATGLRTLFDVAAMPLFAVLGFRADGARFGDDAAEARLTTRRGAAVGLLVRRWAVRHSTSWRQAVATGHAAGSGWCFVFAPPYLSLVDARGCAARRSAEFRLPDAFGRRSAAMFWLLASAAAFDADAGVCPLESHVAAGVQFQDRVRVDLQDGVIQALDDLPRALAREESERRTGLAPFDEALTIVYRVLFLLFAESRDLVPRGHPVYEGAYAVATLCRDALAGDCRGIRDALAAVTRLSRSGCTADDLIVRPFNGQLFARASAPSLERRPTGRRGRPRGPGPDDEALGRSLVSLGTRPGPGGRESISYADLGVEQLGAVYERVLDLEPGRRKQSGTYYTPQSLAEFVVRRTLAPLVAGRSSAAILELRVVDPAMGSGAFLVAACRYLADACEQALIDEGARTADDIDDEARAGLRRLVAERCLSGVDVNPVAVQLARLSLWLASLARGKPLGFLDHQLRVGNSLVGASPEDLRRIADRPGRRDPLPLFDAADASAALRAVSAPLRALRLRADDAVSDVRAKEDLWKALTGASSPLETWRLAASFWCARWFWPRGANGESAPAPPTAAGARAAIDAILRGDRALPAAQVTAWTDAARRAAARHRFFHWQLEFPDVFHDANGLTRARPGFDAVIGNPPWEMLRRDPLTGGDADSADRNDVLRFVRDSGIYGACVRGHLNLYQPFVERALALTRAGGRVGLVLPWGLAVDDGAAPLRRLLLDHANVDTLVGLDNAGGLFPIHRGVRFLALVAGRSGPTSVVNARFGVKTAAELDALPARHDDPGVQPALRLRPADIAELGGSMRRIPDLRTPDDLEFLRQVRRDHPALGSRAGWAARFSRELNASDDRESFGAEGLPVLDGRHLRPFEADVGGSSRRVTPERAAALLPDRRFDRPRLAYRDVSGVRNRQALIAAVIPAGVVTTHTVFCLRGPVPLERQHFLCAIFNSRVMQRIVRLLMGGHLTTSLVEDLPVPEWRGVEEERRIAALARRVSRRADDGVARAELDGLVADLYGVRLGPRRTP